MRGGRVFAVVLGVALAAGLLGPALATAGVTTAAPNADVSNPAPTPGPDQDRLVRNAPVSLSADLVTSGSVIVEFRDARGRVIATQTVSTGQTVTATWRPDIGSRHWQVVVRDPATGTVIDATGEQAVTVTERDPDAACLEFRVEMEDRNFFCAAASPFLGVLPLPVLGMIVWGTLSMGLFIRTGSPIMPFVLLLLTGGAVGGILAGPALSLVTVLILAVVGGVPLLLYMQYARG